VRDSAAWPQRRNKTGDTPLCRQKFHSQEISPHPVPPDFSEVLRPPTGVETEVRD